MTASEPRAETSLLASGRAAANGTRTPGHSLSFDRVYEENFAFVWRTVRALGVPEALVDDAVQDVFLVVLRRLAEFEGRSTLRWWLHSILVRVVRDYRRTARRKDPAVRGGGTGPDVEEVPAGTMGRPDERVERAQSVQLLQELLNELEWNKRHVLVLVEIEQLTVPEIAELTGTNENTVYARLRAARRDFSEIVARHGARLRGRRA